MDHTTMLTHVLKLHFGWHLARIKCLSCLIIALFGAPLAVTTPRAGPAGGVALSLAIALIFLLLTQLTKAIGAGGVINPLVAAWFPNVIFLFGGLVLLAKVRT